jgi:mRNA interferase RelE/StbE
LGWLISLDEGAKSDLAKLDKPVALRITKYLRERLSLLDDPRSVGKPLKGSKLGEFWRYRVGDYRIIASIEDKTLCVLVVHIGGRKNVYHR